MKHGGGDGGITFDLVENVFDIVLGELTEGI